MGIPFVDLKAQYFTIKDQIDQVVSDVIGSTQFIGGKRLDDFEANFASYVDGKYAVGTSSGTSALHTAFTALDIGKGDEVITASNTFIATAEAISHTGATPVFVDVVDDSLLIDPAKVEAAITQRTKAIVPVHLYGQSADMNAINDIAARHSLIVVADAAQAHGATLDGSRKALHGKATCFSFYPGKNLGAYGEGGMVVTDDADLVERMKRLRNHGSKDKYTHVEVGYNYRLDTMQASILDVKLRHLDTWNASRHSRAERYDAAFAGGPVWPVGEAPGRRSVYHLYVIRTENRDRLLDEMGKRGIGVGIHYPLPLHLQAAYAHLGMRPGDCPVAEKAAGEILSLPMYAELSDDMVDEVVAAVNEIVG
ncbi:MAG: DegT/DnrJ/EryC1/StrS family aminotransferase [Candidatus Latescibacterota bacterium]|nr:MAG: DegT/DnrJ/EryC1/StrS family aminotransferase [Candidatus Latescibacterota bacterium]